MKTPVRELILFLLCLSVALLAGHRPFEWSLWTAVLSCLAMPLRLRWPWLSGLLSMPGVAGGLGWSAALVTQYRIGRTERSVPIMSLWVLLLTAASIIPVIITEDLPLGAMTLATAFAAGMAAAPVALGALVTARRDLTRSLQEVRRARLAELEALETSARAAERGRIAREIHDAVGHHATLIAVESAALAATTSDPAVRSTALRLRGLAKESLAEMRTALGLLSSGVTYESLDSLVDRARSAGLAVSLSETGSSDISPPVERALFRVVQEALTNVTKHAPGAPVSVEVVRASPISVTVSNGPSPSSGTGSDGGQGLHGLSERVRTVGGTFRTSRRPDGGFVVSAVLPAGKSKVDGDDSTFGGSQPSPATA